MNNGSNGQVSSAIIEQLEDAGVPLTLSDLIERTGLNKVQIDNALQHLYRLGRIDKDTTQVQKGRLVTRLHYTLPKGNDAPPNLNVAPVTTEAIVEAIPAPPAPLNSLRDLPVELLHVRRLQHETWIRSLLELIAQAQEEVDSRRHDMARIDEEICRRKISTPM